MDPTDPCSGLPSRRQDLSGFAELDGYDWSVTPLAPDPCSHGIAKVVSETLQETLETLEPNERISLLDRLYVSSPVSLRLRVSPSPPVLDDLYVDVLQLVSRFQRSHPRARLLSIPGTVLMMDCTLRDLFDPALAVEEWPRMAVPCSPNRDCPVCGASPRQIQAAYPGTDGCTHCGTIFVMRD